MREEIKQIRSKNTSLASLLEPTAIDQIEALITKAQSEVLQAVRDRGPRDIGGYDDTPYKSGANFHNRLWHTAINTVAKERGLS